MQRTFWNPARTGRLLASLLSLCAAAAETGQVTLLRTPDGGIQPQAAVDSAGTLHLVYFKGPPEHGDLFYVRRPAGADAFSNPIQVNRQPSSAVAIGTIRGAQFALGRQDYLHIAWNGRPPKGGSYKEAPMQYTRLRPAALAFEPERDVITLARGLDGGGSIAADKAGNVWVLWHAPKPDTSDAETDRAVFIARSTDDGQTFAPERLATAEPTGVCACCGMKAFANDQGSLFVLYRAAADMVNRPETLLRSRDYGDTFEAVFRHPWKTATCPMSSASLSCGDGTITAAWETENRVYFARVLPTGVSDILSPFGVAEAKHPVTATNAHGEVLLAWTEGTAWARGGSVVWQRFDQEGKPLGPKGRAEGLPAWSLATAAAISDGSFLIVY